MRSLSDHVRFSVILSLSFFRASRSCHSTYAVFKPRNVLSASGTVDTGRKRYPTLTDVMKAAGVVPLPGHVGRLDAETSGLVLVTSDSLLLRGVLGWPEVLEEYGGTPVSKNCAL